MTSTKMMGQIEGNNVFTEKLIEASSGDSFNFFLDDFNLISFQKENISIGLNGFVEEDLPEENRTYKNFFLYNFGINYSFKRFDFSLILENFFDLGISDFSIEPATFNQTTALVYLEPDASSMINLGITFNF